MSNDSQKAPSVIKSQFAVIVIPVLILVSFLVFFLVLGDGSNFEGGDNANHPLPGNYLGIVFKGGPIVPILLSMLLMTFTFSIERFLTLNAANGSGSVENFVRSIKSSLASNNLDEAISASDKQKGSVGNVIKSVLEKYKEVAKDGSLDKEQKVASLHKEIEDVKGLELPILERNLPILATLGSVATLVALLGTVLGMIKAFAAMSSAGAPDATALANGISEALVNTAIGIGTSAIAIIFYNFFTNKIDTLKYRIDETGLSIINSFSSNTK
jgi:biopolymer transport protein ExbB